MKKLTPKKWCEIFGEEIIDPDGWRGKYYAPYDEKICFEEFCMRWAISTCKQPPHPAIDSWLVMHGGDTSASLHIEAGAKLYEAAVAQEAYSPHTVVMALQNKAVVHAGRVMFEFEGELYSARSVVEVFRKHLRGQPNGLFKTNITSGIQR